MADWYPYGDTKSFSGQRQCSQLPLQEGHASYRGIHARHWAPHFVRDDADQTSNSPTLRGPATGRPIASPTDQDRLRHIARSGTSYESGCAPYFDLGELPELTANPLNVADELSGDAPFAQHRQPSNSLARVAVLRDVTSNLSVDAILPYSSRACADKLSGRDFATNYHSPIMQAGHADCNEAGNLFLPNRAYTGEPCWSGCSPGFNGSNGLIFNQQNQDHLTQHQMPNPPQCPVDPSTNCDQQNTYDGMESEHPSHFRVHPFAIPLSQTTASPPPSLIHTTKLNSDHQRRILGSFLQTSTRAAQKFWHTCRPHPVLTLTYSTRPNRTSPYDRTVPLSPSNRLARSALISLQRSDSHLTLFDYIIRIADQEWESALESRVGRCSGDQIIAVHRMGDLVLWTHKVSGAVEEFELLVGDKEENGNGSPEESMKVVKWEEIEEVGIAARDLCRFLLDPDSVEECEVLIGEVRGMAMKEVEEEARAEGHDWSSE